MTKRNLLGPLRRIPTCTLVLACLCFTTLAQEEEGVAASPQSWAQWRGPLGTGVAPDANPPLEWSETKNVRWKTALPGRGQSSPIVWGDRVFLTSAVPYGDALEPKPDTAPGAHDNEPVTRRYESVVMAVDRSSGEVLWKRTVARALPHERHHISASFAPGSPVTDGKHLIAFFGSRGLFGLDLDGNLLWKVDLGKMQVKHAHGEGSSPALFGDSVIVNWDHEGQSFLATYEKATGKLRWKTERDEPTSWASPVTVAHGDGVQVVVSGTNRLRGYDLADGKVLWECGGLSHNVVATPIAADGMVYAGSSYEKQAFLALRLQGASGDVTESDNVVWKRRRSTPYVPSPLLYGDSLYFLRHYQGVLVGIDARSGEELWRPLRLDGIRDVYASLVGAADRIYVVDRGGVTAVIRHGGEPAVLARNWLDDSFSATPAIVDEEIFLRGTHFLYCIAED